MHVIISRVERLFVVFRVPPGRAFISHDYSSLFLPLHLSAKRVTHYIIEELTFLWRNLRPILKFFIWKIVSSLIVKELMVYMCLQNTSRLWTLLSKRYNTSSHLTCYFFRQKITNLLCLLFVWVGLLLFTKYSKLVCIIILLSCMYCYDFSHPQLCELLSLYIPENKGTG